MAKATSNEIQVFQDFTDEEVLTISNYSEKKVFQRDEVVFKEKSKDCSLYVVLSGKLEAVSHTSDNQKISLSTIDEGEVFGELSFLDGKPRSATILAVTDVELLQIAQKDFKQLRTKFPAIASKLILDLARVVSLRLRNADKFIVEIFQLINQDNTQTEPKAASNGNKSAAKTAAKTATKAAPAKEKAKTTAKGKASSTAKAPAKPASKAKKATKAKTKK